MPANLTPEFYEAQKEFRQAKDPFEKLRCLERMLAVIPKHKGTEKMQADIKSRIKKLKDTARKKKGGKRTDFYYIEREGAGQVVLLGFPSVGKSSLLRTLTNAKPEVAEYPYTTTMTLPGMMPHRKIQIQLVDTPPMNVEYMENWLPNVVRIADGVLLVIDLQSRNILEQVDVVTRRMEENKTVLTGEKVPHNPSAPVVKVRTMIVANKLDGPKAESNLEAFSELYGDEFPIVAVSAAEDRNLDDLKECVYDMLDIIRVFTKQPGKDADMETPYVLEKGSTIIELAAQVHKEIAESLDYARVWGSSKFDGQKVQRDYVLSDGDIVELN